MLQAQWLIGAASLAVGSGHSGLEKSKEEEHKTDLCATGGLKAQTWCRWTVGAQQLTEDLG